MVRILLHVLVLVMASVFKISYHKRLFLMLLAFSWSIILCFTCFQYIREKQHKSDLLNAQLQQYNQNLLNAIDQNISYEKFIKSHRLPFHDLRISVITHSGKVIFDNRLSLNTLDNHRLRPEIAATLKNGSGYHIGRLSASDGREYFYAATRGQHVVVRTAIPYSASLHELLQADWTFFGAMFIVSLIMSVLAYFATRRLGKNIERLNRFAEKAEKGETFYEDKDFPNDELGSISNHIIKLYTQWQQTIKDRDLAHEATLREEQEKIRIKRQLTNNINHELKTPVASIQICLETLLSEMNLKEEKRTELIEKCYSQNLRLRRLLEEVSLITRMEDGCQSINNEPIQINQIINEIVDELKIFPDGEKMITCIKFNEDVVIEGNPSLIISIFRNLTENSILYSGGKHIYISLLKNNEDECLIRFEDDGCGVEEKQIGRLFERFYRIDKGRSRQKGGTGLGLAIVKHAVQYHGGTIKVSNRPSGGLRFEFSFLKRRIKSKQSNLC